MKVILNEDFQGLGEEGDICNVKNGFARNFLLPKDLALPYSQQNLILLEKKKAIIDSRKEEKRKQALSLKEKLEEEELKFSVSASETGKLFGSVNTVMIAEELEKKGFSIDRKRIELPDSHLRTLGNHSARIKLYGNEEAQLKITVEKAAE